MSEYSPIDTVAVVGGGDAGLLTALALERNVSNIDLKVIDDSSTEPAEVGKSTLAPFLTFLHDFLGIERERLVENVKLNWKTTVYYEDWCGRELHAPLGFGHLDPEAASEGSVRMARSPEEKFYEFYQRHEVNDFTSLWDLVGETPGATPMVISDADVFSIQPGLPSIAYQFQTSDFNRLLRAVCEDRGVGLVDDRITDVRTDENEIASVRGHGGEYTADLYLDATGFARELVSELSNEFTELDLPADSAIVTETDVALSESQSATVVTTGEAGWFWQIDAWDVRDLGYVYSSDHLTEQEAKRELEQSRDEALDPGDMRVYHWTPGAYEQPWVTNCLAVGSAWGFPEPLNSLSLTLWATQAERLARLLGRHGRINSAALRELYNDSGWDGFTDVYQFITLFYKYNSGDGAFWEQARDIDPGEIQPYEAYHTAGFTDHFERASLTRTQAETELNSYPLYYMVLRGLGVESEFYDELDVEIPKAAVKAVEQSTARAEENLEDFLSYRHVKQSFHPGYD